MKLLISCIALAISLTACGIFTFSEDVITPVAETQTIIGTVIENNQEAPADGNNFLIVETETDVISVLYLQGGRVLSEYSGQQCLNNELVANFAQSIQVGDSIEIFGASHELYTLEVCSNTDFYITVLEADSQASEGTTRQVTGNIVDFINECPVDGICAYIIETDTGEEVTVIWAEGMSPICQNDPFNGLGNNEFNLGDTIDSLGRVIDESTMSACGDDSYYIRKES